eukprot:CAMPEP_0115160708 /NCGR_PEP_ID=MMETSP0227-20121206/70962_1 /TAXON_ID=89957 /ORGANISM="Polarella glacialis, Strain CCMP 1383" /LENGTH=51 /DNA_ID=CAMNT_0002572649 /DNA_START=632 /DNA_END=787 /DNA_ORIENTATION=+
MWEDLAQLLWDGLRHQRAGELSTMSLDPGNSLAKLSNVSAKSQSQHFIDYG